MEKFSQKKEGEKMINPNACETYKLHNTCDLFVSVDNIMYCKKPIILDRNKAKSFADYIEGADLRIEDILDKCKIYK